MAIIEHAGYYENAMYSVSHAHTSCEIIYILSGSIEVTINNQKLILEQNDCLLIKSRQHHEVKVSPDTEYRRFITIINPWELKNQLVRPDLFTMMTDISKLGFILVRNKPNLQESFEKMASFFEFGGNIYEELSIALFIISTLYNDFKPPINKDAISPRQSLTNRVRNYIEKNYADDVKIADIAIQNYISVGHLSHTFKAETGMSPREYLSHTRCTRAYKLICYTNMTFSDISSHTGFSSANDMSRKIREYYGLPPTKIRKMV